ncbi:hypothetical protein BS330_13010 [Amycolatopsis keratiniphila subsp. nogabecina]|nr:hypothetical protein BS330_13010 [Amycolatopsis keratiniphila subsp. nogabecina]
MVAPRTRRHIVVCSLIAGSIHGRRCDHLVRCFPTFKVGIRGRQLSCLLSCLAGTASTDTTSYFAKLASGPSSRKLIG